ncbi:MAG TPA: hypothetical protein VLT33_08355 [Labilithrix sp.]|nr:hypothetical protein [Labilithrix sp.]
MPDARKVPATSSVGPADRLLRLAVMGGALASLVAAHATLIGYKTFANVDEAYAAALAARLLDGHKLYEGAISQRGPLMYYAYAAIAAVAGWDNVVALRLVTLAVVLGQVAIVAWAGTRLVSYRVGSLAAAIMTYILVAGLPPIDGLALHGETMQAPLLVGGAVVAWLAGGSPRERRLLFLAGLLFGAAIAIKQSALLQPAPVVLMLLARARRSRIVPWASLGALVAGIVVVLAGFAVHAALSGTLGGLVYYCFTYNVRVHLRPADALFSHTTLEPLADHVKRMTSFVLVGVTLLAASGAYVAQRTRAALRERSRHALLRGFGAERYLGAHALVATVAASSMYRFFPHYYLPALPFVALALAAWVARRVRTRVHRRGVLGIATSILIAGTLVVGGLQAYAYEKIDGQVTHGPTVKRVARYIEATTAPDAKVFVWGFSPWLHEYAHRKPAGRYVFETYVTGFVPWFFDASPKTEAARAVPGSMDALLGDLDREHPELVIDAGSVILARPMRAYAKAAAWLHEHYCFELRVSGYDVYRRKPAGGCASDTFPRAHAPVDFYGTTMPIPMPLLVDEDAARALCPHEEDEPVWFAGASPPPAAGLAMLVSPNRALDTANNRAAGIAYPSELGTDPPCDPGP